MVGIVNLIPYRGILQTYPDSNIRPDKNRISKYKVYPYKFQELEQILKNMFPTAVFINSLLGEPLTDAVNVIDKSGKEHNGTYKGTWTNLQKIPKGIGNILSPNGTDNYINLGDSNDFSFGDGSNDVAFSVAGIIEVVVMASGKTIISKSDTTAGSELREWNISLRSAEQLRLEIFDESNNVEAYALSSQLSSGFHSFVITYSGIGGITAANGIIIYVDGLLDTTTPNNNASYVSMENLNTECWIGAYKSTVGTPTELMIGDLIPPIIDKGTVWTSAQVNKFHQIMKEVYNL